MGVGPRSRNEPDPCSGRSDGRTDMKQRTTSISQIRTVAIPVADQERSLRSTRTSSGSRRRSTRRSAPDSAGSRSPRPAAARRSRSRPSARRARDRHRHPVRDGRCRGRPRGAEGRGRGRRRGDPSLPRRPADVHAPRPGREPPLRRRAHVIGRLKPCQIGRADRVRGRMVAGYSREFEEDGN